MNGNTYTTRIVARGLAAQWDQRCLTAIMLTLVLGHSAVVTGATLVQVVAADAVLVGWAGGLGADGGGSHNGDEGKDSGGESELHGDGFVEKRKIGLLMRALVMLGLMISDSTTAAVCRTSQGSTYFS